MMEDNNFLHDCQEANQELGDNISTVMRNCVNWTGSRVTWEADLRTYL